MTKSLSMFLFHRWSTAGWIFHLCFHRFHSSSWLTVEKNGGENFCFWCGSSAHNLGTNPTSPVLVSGPPKSWCWLRTCFLEPEPAFFVWKTEELVPELEPAQNQHRPGFGGKGVTESQSCCSLYPAGRLCWAQGTQSHGAGAERAADCHPEWTTEHQDSAEQNAHRELHSPKWLQNILRMDSSCVFFTPCKAILLHLFFKQRTQMVCSTHALKKGSFVCIVCFFLLTHLNEESVDTQAGSQSEQPVLSKQVGRWKPLKN